MAGISDLPMLHDIDADYSPQYVKLARILRAKIELESMSGETSYRSQIWLTNISPGHPQHPICA